jgi:hypothetical protein
MRKCKLALLGIAIFASVLLTGCNDDVTSTYPLKVISESYRTTVFYDQETKVIYVEFYHGGCMPLYNADGTLKLYGGDKNVPNRNDKAASPGHN